MIKLGTDVAFTVSDREAAADFYVRVMGFTLQRQTDDWVHLTNGDANWYLTDDEGASPMFCFVTDDIPSAVAKVIEAGGRILSETETETHVQDAFGVSYCIEGP